MPADGVIRVVVAGPDGRMGSVLTRGLSGEHGLTLVGTLRRSDASRRPEVLAGADVLVDFTTAAPTPELCLDAIAAGVRPVSGTSGVPEAVLAEIDGAARDRGIGAVWAPHFRLAGVLMMHFARIAARYMSSVEILEGHHAGKADSPSGTARELARMIRDAHGSEPDDPPVRSTTVDGVRGGRHEGVRIHSVRLPSDMGWHEILFGGPDEVLTIRHDEFDRNGYVATVSRAVHAVMRPDVVGLIRGYDAVIGLDA